LFRALFSQPDIYLKASKCDAISIEVLKKEANILYGKIIIIYYSKFSEWEY
jgi:hypothetical protein